MTTIASLLGEVSAPAAVDSFHVRRIATSSSYFVGRDGSGCAALLIESTGPGKSIPLRLAGIEARFCVPCRIAEAAAPEQTQTLTVILCLSRDETIEGYFAGVLDALVANLPPLPTSKAVEEAVDELIGLFQKLQSPAKRTLAGLVGELCFILFAEEPLMAVEAWRCDPAERFDFVTGNLRLDVKASTSRSRGHEISFEQANVPPNTRGIFASIWIEQSAGGVPVRELLSMIEGRIAARAAAVGKLRSVVADTLGSSLPAALDWRFDLHLARSSLQLFDAAGVPGVRGEVPSGVTAVRWRSDFSLSSPLPVFAWARCRRDLTSANETS